MVRFNFKFWVEIGLTLSNVGSGLASGVWIGSVFLNLLTQFGLLQRWKIDADRVMGKGKDLIAIQEPSQPKAQIDG